MDAAEPEIYLTYRDATVHLSDLSLVSSSTAWLNDAIVNYWFERLAAEHDDVLFLAPCAAFMLMHLDALDASEILADTADNQYKRLASSRLSLIPINDGGTHWSLLVLQGTQFTHCDSSACNSNAPLRAGSRATLVV